MINISNITPEIVVNINGELIKVNWGSSRRVADVIVEAFQKSTQIYSKTGNYLIRDRDLNLLHPDSKVGFMNYIEVILDV